MHLILHHGRLREVNEIQLAACDGKKHLIKGIQR